MSSNAGTRFFQGPRALKRAVMSSTDNGAALAVSMSATARTCAIASLGHACGLATPVAATSAIASAPVSISACVGAGWFRARQFQQRRQLGQEQLVVRALAPVGVLPTRDEGFDVIGGLVHAFPLATQAV